MPLFANGCEKTSGEKHGGFGLAHILVRFIESHNKAAGWSVLLEKRQADVEESTGCGSINEWVTEIDDSQSPWRR